MKTADRSSRRLSGLFLAISILAVLYIILPSLFSNGTSSVQDPVLDISMHDTYWVVTNAPLFGLIAILALFFSLFYLVFTRLTGLHLSAVLGWVHFVGSAAVVLLPVQLVYRAIFRSSGPRRYYSYSEVPMFEEGAVIDLMTLLLVLAVVSQSCFVINVAVSPFRKRSA